MQLKDIANSEDMTLIEFCMSLNDPSEIREYLNAYLGASPQVSAFANEFLARRGLIGAKNKGGVANKSEWEVTSKKGRKAKKKQGGV